MNFIAVINKYSRDTKYTKTKLYHYCEEHKKELESMDIRFKIKSEIIQYGNCPTFIRR